VINLESVRKRYGRMIALDDVTLSIPAGRSVALWGHNGAGKSTTLKCILGLVRYTGRILVDGLDVRQRPREVRSRLGYVPQDLAYYDMTVQATVRLFATLKGVGADRIGAALGSVGLGEEAGKQVGALSGGMRQRLSLALALLADPPVLLLDEPTANLDEQARAELLDLLNRCRASGKTLLFASHRPEEVAALADEVVFLDQGRVVARYDVREFVRLQRAGLERTQREGGGLVCRQW